MFDRNLTPAQYKAISSARADLVRELLIEALQHHLPNGYLLNTDPALMAGNALLAVRPAYSAESKMMISFHHAINYRSAMKDDRVAYRTTVESIRACGSAKSATYWETDRAFGKDGVMEQRGVDPNDLVASVRMLAAEVCSSAPFTAFEWRPCPHDRGGKWELFDGVRKLQSVWKSGSRFGTLMGTCPTTLKAAKAEAELAARLMLRSEHQERLAGLGAGLGAGTEESTELDDQERLYGPAM
ncbi:hypothetical protein [Massilia alkalitolerans]|jgi:hypothetical protein|uniref:hypothetical protein n=1 Tax=Massilia alkalitolerans TaxID=286638 RepID=UPI0003F94522|nr:hypothetical protein [Massilia alkalitolerans]